MWCIYGGDHLITFARAIKEYQNIHCCLNRRGLFEHIGRICAITRVNLP